MSLFGIFKGVSTNLTPEKVPYKDGWCYFTTDDQKFWIDFTDVNGYLSRLPLNAKKADYLSNGSLEVSIENELTSSDDKIPTSKVVAGQIATVNLSITDLANVVDTKMDKENPEGTGSFSLNRKAETTVGSYSSAIGYNNTASGNSAHAEGQESVASGQTSHAEGYQTQATGSRSHAEGYQTQATNTNAHAEGRMTVASGLYSHAEGNTTTASGEDSHAEGFTTTAKGQYSHAEGQQTIANGEAQHVQGKYNVANTTDAFIIGNGSSSARSNAFTVDWNGNVIHKGSLAHGTSVEATGLNSYAGGISTEASGDYSHAEGDTTVATGASSHAEGYKTSATSNYSHAEGQESVASGQGAHAEGYKTNAGQYSHAEGEETTASSRASHAEGLNTKAEGPYSHAEGASTTASGEKAHAEGVLTVSSGEASHSEGRSTTASGDYSHTEGYNTNAIGTASHAGGYSSTANGIYSFVHGEQLSATADYQTVFGKYNLADISSLFIIGNGSGPEELTNAFTISDTGDLFNLGAVNAVNGKFTVDINGDAYIESSLAIGVDTEGLGAFQFGVSGNAIFMGAPCVTNDYTPTEDNHLVNKKYVSENLPILSHDYITASAGQDTFDFGELGILDLSEYYLVYFNGLLLIEGLHYELQNYNIVHFLDWSATENDVCQVVGFKPSNPPMSYKALTITADNAYLLGYDDDTVALVIPERFSNVETGLYYQTTAIADNAFNGKTTLTSVSIPGTADTIGASAFANSGIATASLASGVQTIGDSAFENSALETINIPDTVNSIGASAFKNTNLTSISVPNSVMVINDSTFANCNNLTSVEMTNSISRIEENAFASSGITTFEIPEYMTEIQENTFLNCTALSEIYIPHGITNIADNAFNGCTNLTTIRYDGTEEQWTAITKGTSNDILETVTIEYLRLEYPKLNPASYKHTGEVITPIVENYDSNKLVVSGDVSAIDTGEYIITFIPKEGYKWYDGSTTAIGLSWKIIYTSFTVTPSNRSMIGYTDDTTNLIIPATFEYDGVLYKVISIGESAFYDTWGLISVSIPNGVTSIGYSAFNDCHDLTTITIPNTVISISSDAFNACTELTTVNYTGTEEEWNNIDIDNDNGENGYLINATKVYNYTG